MKAKQRGVKNEERSKHRTNKTDLHHSNVNMKRLLQINNRILNIMREELDE